MTDGERYQYPNPYLAATTLEPGREQLLATEQFLAEELHHLDQHLSDLEADDGSVPDEASNQWNMVKGRLDQTRVVYGLVAQSLLVDDLRGGEE